ncbi:MAG: hypothetical protein ACE5G8_12050, partial [Anaerolineae bacterium]
MTPDNSLKANPDTRANRLLAAIVAASLLLALWSQWPYLADKYRVIKDVQNFYWMDRFQDPDLFTTDYLWGYRLLEVTLFGRRVILLPRSLGFGLVFYAASFFTDHIWFSKTLIFLLLPLCVIYLFKLGRLVGDTRAAASLSLFFVFFILASPQSISLATGVQRAFAIPLLIMLVYYLTTQNYAAGGALMFVSLLFYFPNFPLAVLTYGLSMARVKGRFKAPAAVSFRRLAPFVAGLALSGLVVALTLAVESPASYTPRQVPIIKDPQYRLEGNAPMFPGPPLIGRAGLLDSMADIVNVSVLLAFCGLVYAVLGRRSLRQLPPAAWYLLAAGLVMYAASLVFVVGLSSFALYLPSRYSRAVLFLVPLCFVGLNWPDFLAQAPAWYRKNARSLWLFIGAPGLLALGMCALLPASVAPAAGKQVVGVMLSGVAVAAGSAALCWLAPRLKPRLRAERSLLKRAAAVAPLLAVGAVMVSLGAVYLRRMPTVPINPTPAERDIFAFVSTLPKD